MCIILTYNHTFFLWGNSQNEIQSLFFFFFPVGPNQLSFFLKFFLRAKLQLRASKSIGIQYLLWAKHFFNNTSTSEELKVSLEKTDTGKKGIKLNVTFSCDLVTSTPQQLAMSSYAR